MDSNKFKKYISEVSNFPQENIEFKDITSLFLHSNIWIEVIDELCNYIQTLDYDVIIGPESRSFMFLGALSYKLNKPFIILRKHGKLPRKTLSTSYNLEYGSDSLEIHEEDIKKYQKILIFDDVLATGGTIQAINELMNNLNKKVVENVFLIEIESLKGREKINNNIYSLVRY